jgi:hypothetical protein
MRIDRVRVSTTVFAAVMVVMAGTATPSARAQATQPSLYERLGGEQQELITIVGSTKNDIVRSASSVGQR